MWWSTILRKLEATVPNSTPNTWRPRLHPRLGIQIAEIARRKNISPERTLLGVIQAGIGAMSGMNIVQMPPPPAQRQRERITNSLARQRH
jgi:hypothetical protein